MYYSCYKLVSMDQFRLAYNVDQFVQNNQNQACVCHCYRKCCYCILNKSCELSLVVTLYARYSHGCVYACNSHQSVNTQVPEHEMPPVYGTKNDNTDN